MAGGGKQPGCYRTLSGGFAWWASDDRFLLSPGVERRGQLNPSITVNADNFALHDLSRHFNPGKDSRNEPQLLLVASDGELYGHHQPLRDRFLARLVDGATGQLDMLAAYPALWLRYYQPTRWISIRENTSWSCHHGVARWADRCQCTPGSSHWKAHLRQAFEDLTQVLDKQYIEAASQNGIDPWRLRNGYIRVMLGQQSAEDYIAEMAGRRLEPVATTRLHMLLEAQRERQRMYTSCGWYHEDFDRIEPKNNVAYAAQAARLLRMATGIDVEDDLQVDFKRVISDRSGLRADKVFRRHLHRAVLDGRLVAGD